MTATTQTLEAALKAFADQHNFTSLTVGYRAWSCVKGGNEFDASLFFDNPRAGMLGVATASGATISDALTSALRDAAKKRNPFYGVEFAPEVPAALIVEAA